MIGGRFHDEPRRVGTARQASEISSLRRAGIITAAWQSTSSEHEPSLPPHSDPLPAANASDSGLPPRRYGQRGCRRAVREHTLTRLAILEDRSGCPPAGGHSMQHNLTTA